MAAVWNALLGWFAWTNSDSVCERDFPKVYAGFVDHVVDTLRAQGPVRHTPDDAKAQVAGAPALTLPAVERLVAIGDLHGDFEKTRKAFRLAGLIDEQDKWSGGTTTAVQVGDQLDRGDNEVRILYFLERLQQEAARSGGALHVLTGNHETMNVAGRFRYTTPNGVDDFASYMFLDALAGQMKQTCGCKSEGKSATAVAPSPVVARAAALYPGGPFTRRFLAPHPVVLQIGSTVFVHGGLLPHHVRYGLDRINAETAAWMRGEGDLQTPAFLGGRDAVVWAREYSQEDERRCRCDLLEEALSLIPNAERMVVGHTIQAAGINAACGGRVFRIDVGLSHGCGDGEPEVLEILKDKEIRRLRDRSKPTVLVDSQGNDSAMWAWWQKERQKLRVA